MLSYRHGFHAGNHADVLKHLVLVRALQLMQKKPKPLCYLDTHAGGGAYSLTSAQADKTAEFRAGIGRLWDESEVPAPVTAYLEQVRHFSGAQLTRYPGSPQLASQLLGATDRILLHDLHRTELRSLERLFGRDRRVRIREEDGFAAGVSNMPPRERRGLMLIDPPYEIKTDYERVVKLLQDAHRRFSTGVFALWYPVVERARIDRLERALQKSGIRRIDLYELAVRADAEPGMGASGMVVINPPWPLREEMDASLPWLAEVLGENGAGRFRVQELVGE